MHVGPHGTVPPGPAGDPPAYGLEVLIPTVRFVFSVRGATVRVLPEHRSPEAFALYRDLRDREPVVGMTTFPNTVLLRGPATVLVDPGAALQNEPLLKALAWRGLGVDDLDVIALTHAHGDHVGALPDLPRPVAVHERELAAPYWPPVGAMLAQPPTVLRGEEGELAPGLRWIRTPGHSDGGVSLVADTPDGTVVVCGDVVGPTRAAFDAMDAGDGPHAAALLDAWRRIRAERPALVVPGHLPPFRP